MRPRVTLLLLGVLSLACTDGGAASPTPSGPGSPGPSPGASPGAPSPSPGPSGDPTDSRDLVLRVESGGGLAGDSLAAIMIPHVSVYADGRVIMQGAQIEIYPGPALPPLLVTRLTPAGLQRVIDAAEDAGLVGPDRHYDLRGIVDATTTTFTVAADGRTHIVSAYALGLEEGFEGQLDPTELQARRALTAFQALFFDLPGWLGPDVLADGLPYAFDDIRIIARPGAIEDPAVPQRPIAWPLDTPLARFGDPFPMGEGARCGTVSGDDLETLLPRLQQATEITAWTSGDERYQLLLRPLLPDESGCPRR